MQFLPLYNSKTITLPIGVQSSCYGQLSIRFMSKEQHNELLKVYNKGGFCKYDKGRYTTKVPRTL